MLRRITAAPTLVALAGFAALAAGAGMALAHGGDATAIHGCIGGEGKAVKIIAAPGIGDPNATCKSGETAVDWSQTGPPGAAGPTSLLHPGGATVVHGPSTVLSHTVTADEAGLTVAIATVHLFDRDSVSGGGTGVSCALGGFHGEATADVADLEDTGEPGILHRDREMLTLLGRGVLEEGDIVFVGCSAFAGDDDEAGAFADLLLEHVSS
jgi:hypothetical protein